MHPIVEKPSNPSADLDKSMNAVENNNNVDTLHKRETNNMLENKLGSVNNTNKNTKEKIRNIFNNSASKFSKLSKNLRSPSKFIDILIDNAPYLTEPINLICMHIEKLVKLADAQKNELIEKNRLKPHAQYQLLVRFLRACAFKQAKLPRDAKEEDIILKTTEVEFEKYRKNYPNKNYPSTYAKNYFKNEIQSFLTGNELNIEGLFHVYGL